MEGMEEKLGSILSNPQLMQQIMSMAQSLNQSVPGAAQEAAKPTEGTNPLQGLDLSMVKKLSGLAGQGGIDPEQQALLKALSPFLARDRVAKLEKAMRAAKMARLASGFLNSGGLQLLTGR